MTPKIPAHDRPCRNLRRSFWLLSNPTARGSPITGNSFDLVPVVLRCARVLMRALVIH